MRKGTIGGFIFFLIVALALAIVGIVTEDGLWYVRAGIVLVGAGVYWLLVKKKLIGKKV